MGHGQRFTEQAQAAVTSAHAIAQGLNHLSVEPEHLLVALIRQQGDAVTLLGEMKLDIPRIEAEVLQGIGRGQWAQAATVQLSARLRRAVEFGYEQARMFGSPTLGPSGLLLGIIREGRGPAGETLARQGVTIDKGQMALQSLIMRAKAIKAGAVPVEVDPDTLPISISPIFAILVILTLGAAAAAYLKFLLPVAVFVFVVGGWMITLCLHEFGHALVAFVGGDTSVTEKGYLSFNPLRYTHPVFSILLPILFLAIGGIGLPGGAVYINRAAIKSRGMNSLVSAGGPIATALCAVFLLLPFAAGYVRSDLARHAEFWGGYAVLAFLQITALFFNLLPLPPLDGFGIIAAWLPDPFSSFLYRMGSFTFIIMLIIFVTPLGLGFWRAIYSIGEAFHLDLALVIDGLKLFRFWIPS